ncbi:hypothetical protein [Caldanaerobacter subterraneus]|uniref:Uncharacterized protein n=1 Tax=Caldanaerobacter subterraneus TaxID=911092 RepID=A0A7Y2PJY9_9THEO|nr:hypothetical protein [Caldanaerobacter subterraneus]NNG66399.1 hypothetical protein [Caldanaerobacter subterraneus]
MKTEKEIALEIVSLTQNLETVDEVIIFTDMYIAALETANNHEYDKEQILKEMRDLGEWRV